AKPARDNFLVRWLKAGYLGQLNFFLNRRWLALAAASALIAVTALALPRLGREFMPELEEGNMYIRAIFPINISLEEATEKVRLIRSIMGKYPEVQLIMSQSGRPDDGPTVNPPASVPSSGRPERAARRPPWSPVERPPRRRAGRCPGGREP